LSRCRHTIIKAILETCRFEGVAFTHVMYKCQISYAMTSQYLHELKEKGFLLETSAKKDGKTLKWFRTTLKGAELIKLINQIELMLDNPDAVFNTAIAK